MKSLNLNNQKLEYISSGLVIINGLMCIIYRDKLLNLLPIICGGILLIKGIIRFIEGFLNKDYAFLEKTNMEKSIPLIAVGIGILIKQSDALFIVGMFWGVYGLIKSTNYLNIALYNFYNKDKYIVILIKSIVEFSLSLILIFDPFGKIGHHITILGLELILDGYMELASQYRDHKFQSNNINNEYITNNL